MRTAICLVILVATAGLAHGSGCPGTAISPASTDPFAKCFCDIIGDSKATPPRPNCLVGPHIRLKMEALKRAGCVSVATTAQIKQWCLDRGYSEAAAADTASNFGTTFWDQGCVVFNSDADWKIAILGEWRKKSICQHEGTHAGTQSVAGGDVAGAGSTADEKYCALAYREVMAQAGSLLLLEHQLNDVAHTDAEKAKIKEMIKLATARMDEYLGWLCTALTALPDGFWKTKGQKCKDFAKPLNTRVKSYV